MTSVKQDTKMFGKLAAEQARLQILGIELASQPMLKRVPTELVVRSTTGAPRVKEEVR